MSWMRDSAPHGGVDFISTIRAFLQLFRLPGAAIAAITGTTVLFTLAPTVPLYHYILTAYVLAAMNAAACAINDYWDVDKDRIDHPERPLPTGKLSLNQAWWAAVLLFASALIAVLPLGRSPSLLAMVSMVALWGYSPLLRYSGILGNVVVAAIIAAILLLGSLVAHRPTALFYPIGFVFIHVLAHEIVFDMHDTPGDRSQGIVTVAGRWGNSVAFTVVWGLLGLLALSIPMALSRISMVAPRWFTLCAGAMLLIFAGALIDLQRHGAQAYQRFIRWGRVSRLVGIMGLLGAAQVYSP